VASTTAADEGGTLGPAQKQTKQASKQARS